MADKCLCHAYFEGVYDKQIKQGQDFDLAQGVRAIDGYGNEVDFTYEPTEIDLCKTGDQEVTYKAFGASFNVIPKLCMPKYKKGVSIPEACPSDLEMITAKRIIRIIRASNPRFLGIPRVTITENEAFDPTEGVTAVDDNGNTIDFSYEGKYDLVAEGDGIATFETEYEQNAKAVEVALEPIQDGTPRIDSTVHTNPYISQAVSSGDYNTEILESVVGGTVAWNQLAMNGNFATSANWRIYDTSKGTLSISNNIATLTYNAEYTGGYAGGITPYGYSLVIASSHKYLIRCSARADFDTTIRIELGTETGEAKTPTKNAWNDLTWIVQRPSWHSGNTFIIKPVLSQIVSGSKLEFKNIMLIDLTQMFGSTIADYIYSLEQSTAGAGVAWFKKLFPNDYYPYDVGTLKSVQTSGHKVVGFNQWDEEWENGDISSTTGENVAEASLIRSKNYIPIFPNTVYYPCCESDVGSSMRARFYDADKNYIGYLTKGGYTVALNNAFTTPDNAHYMRFAMQTTYGGVYKNDICINISSSRNGEYEPYQSVTYPLDADLTLRGIPKLDSQNNLYYDGDVYKSSGSVTRKYGVVDLGSLSYNYATTDKRFYNTTLPFKQVNASGVLNVISTKYRPIPLTAFVADLTVDMTISSTGNYLFIRNLSYTDAATFQNAMSGTYLVYELATPTTESADPYTMSQTVYDGGTEEFVGAEIPVGHQSRYALVCPISGHDEVAVNVRGKNWLNPNTWYGTNPQTFGGLSSTHNPEGTVSVSGTVGSNPINRTTFDDIKLPKGTYKFTDGYERDDVYFYLRKGTDRNWYRKGQEFTIDGTESSVWIMFYSRNGLTVNDTFYPMIRLASETDGDYEPYDSNTYTTALGRTVYGGTLDVVSGELVVDRAMVDLSTLSWSGSSGIKLSTGIANVVKAPSANNIPANIVAEKYATSAVAPISANDGKIGIEATGYRGRIQCGSSETPSGMLCYELATPQTYQLSPQQVELLKGTNNVWSEEGNVRVIYEGNIPQDGSFEYPLEGEYTITYKATDKCGNEGTAERTIVVTPSE